MSLQAVGIVAEHKTLPLNLRGLAYELANCHNAETGKCFPSIAFLAERAGMTERGLRKALNALENAGVIEIIPRFIDGRQTTNEYRFLRPELQDTPEAVPQDTPEAVPEFTQNQEEETGRVNNTPASDDAFDRFWSAYPKKVDKKKARQAFRNLSKTNQQKAIEDIEGGRYADRERRYVPNPPTYIHGEKWNDEHEDSSRTRETASERRSREQAEAIRRAAFGSEVDSGDHRENPFEVRQPLLGKPE